MATYTKAGRAKTGTSAAAAAPLVLTAANGVSIAFDDGPLVAAPTWTQLDTEDGLIASYSIRVGRQDEFDRTGTGTATIQVNDTEGWFDPTNTGGPYYNNLDGKQVSIALHNPVTDNWRTIFRGLIDDIQHQVDPSQKVSRVTIQCVDGLDYLAGFELRLGASDEFPVNGDPVPAGSTGNIYYMPTEDAGAGGETCDWRINQVLDEASWPAALREVFTGNVHLARTVYSPGTPALSVIDEAADAEFPGIANRYVSKGIFVFHGRLARFNPTDGQYRIHTWKVGDGAQVAINNDYAHLRGLGFSRPRQYVRNSAYFTPQGILDVNLGGQVIEDPTSIAAYGIHSISAENLRIADSVLTGNTGAEECLLYGDYFVTVYADPQTRVNQLVFRSMAPEDSRAASLWNLMCNVDISDRIQLKCTNPGGGGFNDDLFFVEGISYDVRPLQPSYADVTLTLDVSPAFYYDFPWT